MSSSFFVKAAAHGEKKVDSSRLFRLSAGSWNFVLLYNVFHYSLYFLRLLAAAFMFICDLLCCISTQTGCSMCVVHTSMEFLQRRQLYRRRNVTLENPHRISTHESQRSVRPRTGIIVVWKSYTFSISTAIIGITAVSPSHNGSLLAEWLTRGRCLILGLEILCV